VRWIVSAWAMLPIIDSRFSEPKMPSVASTFSPVVSS